MKALYKVNTNNFNEFYVEMDEGYKLVNWDLSKNEEKTLIMNFFMNNLNLIEDFETISFEKMIDVKRGATSYEKLA